MMFKLFAREIVGIICATAVAIVALIVLNSDVAVGLVLTLAAYVTSRNGVSAVERQGAAQSPPPAAAELRATDAGPQGSRSP